ncbi:MAG TPA: DUF1566 domain-containing protein [bacterium]|mgnify:CR=1 FL=1|nr:DUF1566 domain-containing protein [bacterium]
MKNILISALTALSFIIISCGGNDCSGDFPNYNDELCWSDLSDSMTWGEAAGYCNNMGGRLPTISELRTLIKNCPSTETGGECRVTDDCITENCRKESECRNCEDDESKSGRYSVFKDTVPGMWSSSKRTDSICDAWGVNFENGFVGSCYGEGLYSYSYVRCVKN